jgi:hypothetical protein
MEASQLIWRAQQALFSSWSPALPSWELLLCASSADRRVGQSWQLLVAQARWAWLD